MNSSPRQASLLPTASCCTRATISLPRRRGTREKQKKRNHNKINTSQEHHNIQLHSRCTGGRTGVGRGGGRGHMSNVWLPKPPGGLRLSHQDSKNFSHKVEDLMNTVFPLMPWKNYTQTKQTKKKRQKNQDFLHIYKNKPPKPRNQGGGAASGGEWEWVSA